MKWKRERFRVSLSCCEIAKAAKELQAWRMLYDPRRMHGTNGISTDMKNHKKNQPFMEVNIKCMDPMGMDFLSPLYKPLLAPICFQNTSMDVFITFPRLLGMLLLSTPELLPWRFDESVGKPTRENTTGSPISSPISSRRALPAHRGSNWDPTQMAWIAGEILPDAIGVAAGLWSSEIRSPYLGWVNGAGCDKIKWWC